MKNRVYYKSTSHDGTRRYTVYLKGLSDHRRHVTVATTFRSDEEAEKFGAALAEWEQNVVSGKHQPRNLLAWLKRDVSPKVLAKMVEAGLVEKDAEHLKPEAVLTLGQLVDRYLEMQFSRVVSDTEASAGGIVLATATKVRTGLEIISSAFGRELRIDDLSTTRANQLNGMLLAGIGRTKRQVEKAAQGGIIFDAPRAASTVAKYLKMFDEMLTWAVARGFLHRHPIDRRQWVRSRETPSDSVYVDAAVIEELIDATNNPDQKLVLALARYGGLRVPNEIVELRWRHVHLDSELKWMWLFSFKNRRFAEKRWRLCAITPPLAKHLLAIRPSNVVCGLDGIDSEPQRLGTDFVVETQSYRKKTDEGSSACATWFDRLRKAHGYHWPEIFVSLRVSANMDMKNFAGLEPDQVRKMIGNSPEINFKVYTKPDIRTIRAVNLGRERSAEPRDEDGTTG